MGSVQRSVRFPEDVAEAVDGLAARESRSFAQTVVLLVRRGLDVTEQRVVLEVGPKGEGGFVTDTDRAEAAERRGPVARVFENRG